jgi:hypothetical protein
MSGNDASLLALKWGESHLFKSTDIYLVILMASPEIVLHTSSDHQLDKKGEKKKVQQSKV